MLISKIKYRFFISILVLLITNNNVYSKNKYLKYSPSEDALSCAVKPVIMICDKPSSIGLTFYKMKKEKRNFISYEDCKKWVKENELTKNIKTKDEWLKITKKLPDFIPKYPPSVYAKQKSWKAWGDFLVTGDYNRVLYKNWKQRVNKIIIENWLEKETEFLTKSGWKKYDEITENDKIASLNKKGEILFDNYLDRNKSNYSGKIYTYENRYSKFSVTPNHNLFLQYLNRNIKNNFQTKIDIKNLYNFQFATVEDFFSNRKNYSKILHTPLKPLNNDKEYDLTDEEIKILGACISDGCLTKTGKQIRVDQKEGKQLFDFLNKSNYFYKAEYTGSYTGLKYFYFKFKNKKLYNFIENNVGNGSKNKFLSKEFWKFSKRQFDILLEYMIRGDGNRHSKGHSVYYTSSKNLAKDLQTLLFINGMSSQIYDVNHKGGFENSSSLKYYVYICKYNKPFGYFNKTFNWKIKNVKNQSICCFTTKYGNLITRNKNKISIQ